MLILLNFCSPQSFGALLTEGKYGSPLLISNPYFHSRQVYEDDDLNFHRMCCLDADRCDLFHMRRPSDDCSTYRPPRFSKIL